MTEPEAKEAGEAPIRTAVSFVGRERELAEIRQGFARAAAGCGQFFLLSGEAGIGKTRLADRIAEEARRSGARIHWGRCWEAGGAPAYWPWVQILRSCLRSAEDPAALLEDAGPSVMQLAQVAPEIGQHLGQELSSHVALHRAPEALRFALFDAAVDFLRAASRGAPMVLVLDDLHVADAPSLLLLQFVAHELGDLPCMIIGAYREIEARRAPQVARLIAELGREAHAIALGGLGAADVQSLAESLVGAAVAHRLIEPLFRTTGGNPLFVDEMLRLLAVETSPVDPERLVSGALGVPDRVKEVIRRRVDPLSAVCGETLVIASVLGNEFDVTTLERVCDVAPEVLLSVVDDLVSTELLARPTPGRLRFKHALVRETIYGDLSPGHAVRLHRRIAEALEDAISGATELGVETQDAALAHHLFEAALGGGVAAKAVAYARRAGERALAMLAYEDAVNHFARALEASALDDATDLPLRCELLLLLGEAQYRSGEMEAARRTFREAGDLARRLDDARNLARAALGFGGHSFLILEIGRFDAELVRLLDDALVRCPSHDDALRVRLAARLATELYFSDAAARRDELSREAVQIARGLGEPATLAYALASRHVAVWGPDTASERLLLASEVVQLAERAGDREMALGGRWLRWADLLELGDITAADVELDTLAALAEQSRQPIWLWIARLVRASRALLSGRFEEAERLALEASSLGQRPQPLNSQLAFGVQMVLLRREQGRAGEIEAILQTFADRYPAIPAFRWAVPWLQAELGRPARARADVERLLADGLAHLPRDAIWLTAAVLAADLCHELGMAEHADHLYRGLAPFAELNAAASFGAVCFGSVHRGLGLLAALRERYSEAQSHFEAALRANARMHADPWVAYTELAYGQMLLARNGPGDATKARAHVSRGSEIARSLGMRALSERIERAMHSLGGQGDREAGGDRHAPCDGATSAPEPAPSLEAAGNVFRREGDYWTIAYEGHVSRIRDVKGLTYLSRMLREPGREFHVLDLLSEGAVLEASGRDRPESVGQLAAMGLHSEPGDAGEILDVSAKSAYRRRVKELEAEREAAWDAPAGRIAEIEAEIEFLSRQLSGAVGLSGRDRRASAPVERARVNVTRAIKTAIEKLGEGDPALSEHLRRSVRSGTMCVYQVAPEARGTWRF